MGPSDDYAPPAELVYRRPRPQRRALALTAVVTACIASYLLFAPMDRTRVGLSLLRAWWPQILLALAALNWIRVVTPRAGLLGPALLGFLGAGALITRGHPSLKESVDVVPVVLLAFSLVFLARALGPDEDTWICLAASLRIRGPKLFADRVRVRAALGSLLVDLSASRPPGRTSEIAISVWFARLVLEVPASWELNTDEGGVCIQVVERGAREPSNGTSLDLSVTGVVGHVEVIRV